MGDRRGESHTKNQTIRQKKAVWGKEEEKISWLSQSSLLDFQPVCPTGRLTKFNWILANVGAWEIYPHCSQAPYNTEQSKGKAQNSSEGH